MPFIAVSPYMLFVITIDAMRYATSIRYGDHLITFSGIETMELDVCSGQDPQLRPKCANVRTVEHKMYRTIYASILALAIGVITLLGFASPVAAATASSTTTPDSSYGIQGTCGDIFDVYVSGGEAHWNITCYSSGQMNISGNVKDTAADGKCAYVKAFASSGESRVPLAKACPKGTISWYNWTTTYSASWINAYLFTT